MKLPDRLTLFEEVSTIFFDSNGFETVDDVPERTTVHNEVSRKGKYGLSFFHESTGYVFSVEVDMEHKHCIFLYLLRKIQETNNDSDTYLTCTFEISDVDEVESIVSSFLEMKIYSVEYF